MFVYELMPPRIQPGRASVGGAENEEDKAVAQEKAFWDAVKWSELPIGSYDRMHDDVSHVDTGQSPN